jgi:hypothetical protein
MIASKVPLRERVSDIIVDGDSKFVNRGQHCETMNRFGVKNRVNRLFAKISRSRLTCLNRCFNIRALT